MRLLPTCLASCRCFRHARLIKRTLDWGALDVVTSFVSFHVRCALVSSSSAGCISLGIFSYLSLETVSQ